MASAKKPKTAAKRARKSETNVALVTADMKQATAGLAKTIAATAVKRGFAHTPEQDLLWAAGWPMFNWTTDEPDDDLVKTTLSIMCRDNYGLRSEWPRAALDALVRINMATEPWPMGSVADAQKGAPLPTKEAKTIFATTDPVPVETILELVRARFHPKKTYHHMGDLNFLALEALVGTLPLVEACVGALEDWKDAALAEYDRTLCFQLLQIGIMLRRLPAPAVVDVRARLLRVLERANKVWPYSDEPHYLDPDAKGGSDSGDLAIRLQTILNGAQAVARWGSAQSSMLADDDPAVVIAKLEKTTIDKYTGTLPRLAWIAGEPVVAFYRKHWKKMPGHKDIVATFGEIASPAVTEWLFEMAAESKAKTAATQWFARHPEAARPFLERKRDPLAKKLAALL